MIILQEENQELRGKLFPIPDGVKKHLQTILNVYEDRDGDKNNDGYDRLVYLCSQERITMEELKRIKNFFDNYKGTPKSDDYILNGGKPMSDWVNRILKVATDTSRNEKEAKELTGLDDKKQKKTINKPNTEKLKLDKIQTKNLSNSISKNSTVKESKTIYITERQLQSIKEAYNPDTFSFEELTRICNDRGLKEAMNYCTKTLGKYSNRGGSRAVFDFDDDKVLKLGMEDAIQNSVEVRKTKYLESKGITIIPYIYNYEKEHYYWILAERVVPCRMNDFDHILGVPYTWGGERGNINDKETQDFGNHNEYPFQQNFWTKLNSNVTIDGFITYVENDGKYTYDKEAVAYHDLIDKHPWFKQLAEIIRIGEVSDFFEGNFGMAIRNGKPTIVVLDLGV